MHGVVNCVEGVKVGKNSRSMDLFAGGKGVVVVCGRGKIGSFGRFVGGNRGSGDWCRSGSNRSRCYRSRCVEIIEVRMSGGFMSGDDRDTSCEGVQVAEGEGRGHDRSQNSAGKNELHCDARFLPK